MRYRAKVDRNAHRVEVGYVTFELPDGEDPAAYLREGGIPTDDIVIDRQQGELFDATDWELADPELIETVEE